MTAAQTGATMAADGIDFVDEDNAGRVLLGLFEHVAHARCADTDKHFHKVGTGNGKERHLRFTGNRPGQQRLAGTRRTDHQHTLRYLATQFLELARVAQELDQLGHFFLGFLDTGHIVEGNLDLVFTQHARAALAKRHGAPATSTTLHLAHEENPHTDQQQHREPGDKDLHQQ